MNKLMKNILNDQMDINCKLLVHKIKNSSYKNIPDFVAMIKNFPFLKYPFHFKTLSKHNKAEVFKRLKRICVLITEISNIIYKDEFELEELKKNL